MIYFLPRLFTSRLICIVITCWVLLGGWSAVGGNTQTKDATQVARLSQEFKLRARQQVTLNGDVLQIRFAGVENDSRCPADVTCVWAGNAVVLLEVSTSLYPGASKSLKLNTNTQSVDEGEFRAYRDAYKVRLVELSPYPRSNQKIAAGDYTVTLRVNAESESAAGSPEEPPTPDEVNTLRCEALRSPDGEAKLSEQSAREERDRRE